MLLSVQKYSVTSPRFNSFFTNDAIFTDRTAEVNSNQGIDTNFFGTTLAFPKSKLQ